MNCNKCGTNLGESDMFCPTCGTPVQKENNTTNEVQNENRYTYERGVNQQNNNQQQQSQTFNQNYGQTSSYGQYNSHSQTNTYRNPSGRSKNTGDIVKICMAVALAILIIAVIGFVGYSIGSSQNEKDNPSTGEIVVENGTGTSTATGGSSTTGGDYGTVTPTTNNPSTYSYNASFAGFRFNLPYYLEYQIIEDEMFLLDEEH